MLPVTALLAPVTGLTVVTTSSCSCLVKRFTSRRSSSANSQSSKAPAQNPVKEHSVLHSSLEISTGFWTTMKLLRTRVWGNNNTLLRYPFNIYDSCLCLHTGLAEFFIGGLFRLTVDPNRPLPAPTTEAGGTKQQSAIWVERQLGEKINQ